MNNRIRQQYKCVHKQTIAGMYVTVSLPKNPVTGEPPRIVDVDKDQLEIYRQIYGDKLEVINR